MPKKKQGGGIGGEDSSGGDPELFQKCPLASAILQTDLAKVGHILEQSLPHAAQVTDVKVQKSAGEAFTGGRSTPVYSITATVYRKSVNGKSTPKKRHFIVKLVEMMDHDNHDNNNKKLIQLRESYAVERRFYDSLAPHIRQSAPELTIPKVLHADLDGSKAWPIFCMLMNDLTMAGFPSHPIVLQVAQAKAALTWIATFHALFWASQQPSKQESWRLWDRGGFWTKTTDTSRIGTNWLQTIRFIETKHADYLSATGNNLRDFGKRLQNAGNPIQDCLNQLSASKEYGTVIHGDYKAANMFLAAGNANGGDDAESMDASSVAVVDFQHTGFGVCSDDVAYLLYPDARGYFSDADQDELLVGYHSTLIEQLMIHGKGGPSTLSLERFQIFFRLSQLEMTRHWTQKGWAASAVPEVELMLQLDNFMTKHLDHGHVLAAKEHDEKLSKLLCSV